MIQQDRFFLLLAAIDAYEECLRNYRQAIAYMSHRVRSGQMTHEQGINYIIGFDMANSRPLSDQAVQAIANERAHFKANAKRNAKSRERNMLKKDLKRHKEHMAQRAAWANALPAATQINGEQPPNYNHISNERMAELQAEQEGKYEQALKEIAERQAREGGPSVSPERQALVARMEELKAKLPQRKVFTDDEILGDTDGTEDPFA